MQEEYNVDYASYIGALIYLSYYIRPDILYSVNKLMVKFTKVPGEYHVRAAPFTLASMEQ